MINQLTENVEELERAEKVVATEKYNALHLLLDENTEAGKAFKILVLDGYLKDKAVEYTSLLAEPSMKSHRGDIFESIVAVSHLEQYLKMIDILGAPTDEEE